jgi:hypothetical protein
LKRFKAILREEEKQELRMLPSWGAAIFAPTTVKRGKISETMSGTGY